VRVPDIDLAEGAVAPRDLKAVAGFDFVDARATAERRAAAGAEIEPVYDFDGMLGSRLQSRVSEAFDVARVSWRKAARELDPADDGAAEGGAAPADGSAQAEGADPAPVVLPQAVIERLARGFSEQLGFSVDPAELTVLVEAGFPLDIEEATNALIAQASRHYIIKDRSLLPPQGGPISVIRIQEGARSESRLLALDSIRSLDDARRAISLTVLERLDDDPHSRVAATIARAMVRSNFSYNQLLTEERRQDAVDAVEPVVLRIARGTTIVREGDVVTAQQLALVEELRGVAGERSVFAVVGALFAFCTLLLGTIYSFAGVYIRKFSTRWRDLATMGFLLVLVLGISRLVLEVSEPLVMGNSALAATSFWYLVPAAGVALLVRILVNSETSLIFAIVVSVLCGLMMEQRVTFTVFFIVSSVVATGAIGKDRERSSILRAGFYTGLLNAAFVLLLDLILLHMPESGGMELRPGWDASFAFFGGVLSSFLVLGLVPLFEQFGFVTDLQLLELGNLDHPLLRNLMLRAPGTYHHSVIVGTLAEAAAEAVGCNALLCRVCSYFHDIGKAIKPQYFAENQRGMPNLHDKLPPRMSAQLIIDHVREGGAIARRNNLPRPIVDAIYQHHGDGLLKHFYDKSRQEDPDVDEADFRYPGPRPDTREMGIIMLADKTEAACRTIQNPTPERVNAMIQKIINSVIQDGQFQECPLTVKDLYVIGSTFQQVILGIYHHRVEYPETSAISRGGEPPQKPAPEAVITLELPALEQLARQEAQRPEPELPRDPTSDELAPPPMPTMAELKRPPADPSTDYESVQNLPGLETDETFLGEGLE
jgi:putative nucleotidyltransferase with HDIG domain